MLLGKPPETAAGPTIPVQEMYYVRIGRKKFLLQEASLLVSGCWHSSIYFPGDCSFLPTKGYICDAFSAEKGSMNVTFPAYGSPRL